MAVVIEAGYFGCYQALGGATRIQWLGKTGMLNVLHGQSMKTNPTPNGRSVSH
jgi:hypothetical protein